MAQGQEIIRVGQIEIRFLLEGKDSGDQLAMFEFTVPAGARVPMPHSHERYDETIYGLEGVVTFTVNGQPTDIAPGQSCFIPRGAVHGFDNLGRRIVLDKGRIVHLERGERCQLFVENGVFGDAFRMKLVVDPTIEAEHADAFQIARASSK